MEAQKAATIGRYELLLELGRGGMAVLYLARAEGVGGFSKLFAIKQILPHLAADQAFVEMFLNESRIAARLSHPNLCPVFELGSSGGELFLVMEYLDGVPWEQLAAAAPRDARGLQLTAGVLAQACEGLHYAHTFHDVDGAPMSIVHRDVSPQNLFVSADGACRVLDFGVSKIATDRRRTRTGLLKGKLPYMAPEQIHGELVDGRADVWALGVMLWEALAGARLFDRDTDFLTYQAIAGAAIPSVNAGAARYPAAIDRVIARALGRDRDSRYATARELARDLSQVAAEVGGAASREQIADAVGALCGDQLAARRRAIATALRSRAAPRSGPAGTMGSAGQGPLGEEAREPANGSGEAAATISMAMRKDAIVVARRRRRRWTARAVGLAGLALAGGIAVVIATRGGSTPAAPPFASSGSPPASPAQAIADRAPVPGATRGELAAPIVEPPGLSAPVTNGSVAPIPANRPPRRGKAAIGGGGAAPASQAAVRGEAARTGGAASPAPTAARGEDVASASPPGPRRTPLPIVHPPADAAIAPSSGAPAPPPRARERGPLDPTTSAGRASNPALPAPAARGWYAIDSSPYATIFIDENKIGETPLDRISLPAGAHRVRAVLADGRQRTFAIDIAPDRKTTSGTLTW